jgi:hypothetical protein
MPELGTTVTNLRSGRGKAQGESGQVLILWILAATVILAIGAIVVDVGLWLTERRNAQMAADFAALAAASELSDPAGNPQAKGLEFAARNGFTDGLNGVTVDVNTPYNGDSAEVEVTISQGSPMLFTGIFKIGAFDIGARAVGKLGSGEAGPLDAVLILDRTGSMSDADLVNAKDAAKAALRIFDPSIQHIGLGVIRASDPSNICEDREPGLWVPVPGSPGLPFSSDYRDQNGNLVAGSQLVSTIDCLLKSTGAGTNLGDPVRTATQYLNASPRSGVKKAIILMTDGQATHPNGAANLNTGLVDCTAQAPVTSGSGDNNGFEVNPAGACGDGGSSASDLLSGTNTSTNCGNSGKDRHVFSDFNINVPAGSKIEGIEVQLDAWADGSSGSPRMCVELSWDGGNTWTSNPPSTSLSNSESSRLLGDRTDDWGHNWTADELSSANFRVRVTNRSNSPLRSFFLDRVAVQVTYDDGFGEPCSYAFQQANIAKSFGIEVITIGFGIDDSLCSSDSSGPYQNVRVTQLLAEMATTSDDNYPGNCDAENLDRDRYYCEASDEDLTPVFERVAEDLTSGYRLDE